MEQNFEFNWPGNEPLKPKKEKKKPDFKRAGKTILAVMLALVILFMAGTCFYTVDDQADHRTGTSSKGG